MLGLDELHRKHRENQYEEKRWICSERSKKNKQGVDPDPDLAAGVVILLSPRMADRILDQGSEGTRIVYVL